MRIPQTTHVKVSKIVLVLSTLMLVASIAHWQQFVHHPYQDRLHESSSSRGFPQRPVVMEEQTVVTMNIDATGDGAVQQVDAVVSVEANSGTGVADEVLPARRIDYRGMQLSNDDATPPMLGRNGHGQRRPQRPADDDDEQIVEDFKAEDAADQQPQVEPLDIGIVPPHMRRRRSHSPSHSWNEPSEEEEEEGGEGDFAAPPRHHRMRCRFFKRLARAIRFHLGQAGKPALIAAIVVSALGVAAGFTGSSCVARVWRSAILASFFVHLGMLCLRVTDQSFCPALIDHVHKARGAMMGRMTMLMEQPQTSGANVAEAAERVRAANDAFDEVDADPRGFCMRLVLLADFAIALHHVILLLIAGRLQKVARDAEVEYEQQLQAIVGSAIVVAGAADVCAVDAVEMGEQAPLKSVEVVV